MLILYKNDRFVLFTTTANVTIQQEFLTLGWLGKSNNKIRAGFSLLIFYHKLELSQDNRLNHHYTLNLVNL